MKEEVFEEILRCVQLPLGELLCDNSTYRLTANDFCKIKTKHRKELSSFEKFLVSKPSFSIMDLSPLPLSPKRM